MILSSGQDATGYASAADGGWPRLAVLILGFDDTNTTRDSRRFPAHASGTCLSRSASPCTVTTSRHGCPLSPSAWWISGQRATRISSARSWSVREDAAHALILSIQLRSRDPLDANSWRRGRSRSLTLVSCRPQSDGAVRGRWRCCTCALYGAPALLPYRSTPLCLLSRSPLEEPAPGHRSRSGGGLSTCTAELHFC